MEPPPVLHSYREFDGKGNIIYSCKTTTNEFRYQNTTSPEVIIRTCARSYSPDDFRFCEYRCGRELPVESGAQLVSGEVGGSLDNFDAQGTYESEKYSCKKSFSEYRNYPSAALAKCDRGTETFTQPSIGCFASNRNWVKDQPARYAKFYTKIRNQREFATTDESFNSFVIIGEDQFAPDWICDLNLKKGAGDEDVTSEAGTTVLPMVEVIAVAIFRYSMITSLSATVWVLNSKHPEAKSQLCQEKFIEHNDALLACDFRNGHYPVGDRIEIDFSNGVSYVYLSEVFVIGRRWIHSCAAPPPLHEMKLLNFTQTKAHYICEEGWRQVAEILETPCTINRTWELPTTVCSDRPNLALGNVAAMYDLRSLRAKEKENETAKNIETGFITDGDPNSCMENISCQLLNNLSITVALPNFAEVETVLIIQNIKSKPGVGNYRVKWHVMVGQKSCNPPYSFPSQSSNQSSIINRLDCPKLPVGNSIQITLKHNGTVEDIEDECDIDLCEVDVIGYPMAEPETRLECFRRDFGLDYKGIISVTLGGRPCQAWAETSPHRHPYTDDVYFADENVIESGHNYCRYPSFIIDTNTTPNDNTFSENGEAQIHHNNSSDTLTNYTRTPTAPWCNTTDPAVEWEECGVPACAELCALREDQADYMGDLSKTQSNKDCLKWPGRSPDDITDRRLFAFRPDFPDWNFGADPSEHNLCRNPASSQSKAWCYVDKTGTTELCNVPSCPVSPSSSFSSQIISPSHLGQLAKFTQFDTGFVFQTGFQSKFTPFDITRLTSVCAATYFGSFVTLYLLNVSPFQYFHVVLNCNEKRVVDPEDFISEIVDDESCELDLSSGSIISQDLMGKVSAKPSFSAARGRISSKCHHNIKDFNASNESVQTGKDTISDDITIETNNSQLITSTEETLADTSDESKLISNVSNPNEITINIPEPNSKLPSAAPTTSTVDDPQPNDTDKDEPANIVSSNTTQTKGMDGADSSIKTRTEQRVSHHSASSSHSPGVEDGSVSLAYLRSQFENVLDFLAHAKEHRRLENLCLFVTDTSKPWCRCPCPCSRRKSEITQREIEEKIAKINEELKINPNEVSRQVRTKVSTPDNRPSAIGCGSFAIAVMSAIIACTMAGDLIAMAMSILKAAKRRMAKQAVTPLNATNTNQA